jgi:hypothetical protein
MAIKVGNIVSHTGGMEWGVGKVLEITASSTMIQFSDGKNRKIAVSHYASLQPAPPGSFSPPPEAVVEAKAPRAPRAAKKKK